MEEVGVSVATKLAEYLVEPIIQQGQYLFCEAKIKRNFESEKEKLLLAQESVQKRVEDAHRRTDTIDKVVDKWQNDVKSLIEDVEKLQLEMKENKGCLRGWCPIWSSYHLCKQMAKKTEMMVQLNANHEFNPFSHPTPIPDIEYFSSGDFMYFESTTLASNQLLEALGDENCCMIGLYGMGGSGKTTLAKEVGMKAKKSKLFDCVVPTIVSQTPNVRKIQDEIADILGVRYEENSEAGRARRLSMRLNSGEKILIILDDVWTQLNLEDVGILFNNNHKLCKVLLTTRRQRVCTLMGCQKKIPLHLLSENEAWTLFNKHARINDVTQEVVAREVAKECKGLPIALVAMGSCIKEKYVDDVKVVLHRLRHSKPIDVDEGEKDVFGCLRLSYDYLKSREAKLLFLICAIFPEDHNIIPEDLLRYAIGLDVCGQVDSFEIARSQVNAAINILIDSCLLMCENHFISKETYLKMHDVVRDVALWIASKEDRTIMVNHATRPNSLLEDGSMKNCYALGWWNMDIDLPQQLDVPKLKMLLLKSKKDIDLSYASFEGLKGIKVMAIEISFYLLQKAILPHSTHLLTNLRTLRLVGSNLDDISFVVSLRGLEILDFQRSKFKELPNGLENLKKLKLLDLSDCEIDGHCFEVIKRCLQLEELYVYNNNGEANGITDFSAFCLEDVTFTKLQRYQLEVGKIRRASYGDSLCKRSLCVEGLNISNSGANIKDLLQRAIEIYLKELKGGCKNVLPDLVQAVGGMNELMWLDLNSCSEIECVFNTTFGTAASFQVDTLLTNLVKMKLSQMDNLKELNHGPTLFYIFQNLETIEIGHCCKLQSIFPGECNLRNLKYLKIFNCSKLTTLFTMSMVQTLLSIQVLHIENCHELKYIMTNGACGDNRGQQILAVPDNFHLGFSQLKKLFINDCRKLEYIFPIFVVQSLEKLEEIIISKASDMKYLFSEIDHEYHSSYQNDIQIVLPQLKKIAFEGLSNLFKIFPESYHLSRTESINNMVGSEQRRPHLNTEQVVSFPCLQSIKLVKCEKLKCVFPAAIHRSLPELTKLYIYNCEELEEIFEDNEELQNQCTTQVCFPKLSELDIKKCKKLKTIFSVNMARILPQLSSLCISKADKLVEIFRHTSEDNCDNDKEIMLPKLSELVLEELPSLIDLYQGFNLHDVVELCKVKIYKCGRLASISRRSQMTSFHHETKQLQEQIQRFQYLQSIELKECGQLRFVFSGVLRRSLPELTQLIIWNCEELEEIFEEDENYQNQCNAPVCFPKLELLNIQKCNKLKTIFSIDMARILPQLSSLRISYADQLVEIFRHTSEDNCQNDKEIKLPIPKLSELILEELPSLINVCQGFILHAVELRKVVIYECPKLASISLPNQMISFYQRKEGPEANGTIGRKLSNKDPHNLSNDQVCFLKLQRLWVEGCHKLKSVFSASTVRMLPQLRSLEISRCEQLEEIFGCENMEDGSTNRKEIVLPNLTRLHLQQLPSLVDICQESTLHAVELKDVFIVECPKFTPILGVNQVISVHQSKEVLTDGGVSHEIQAFQDILNVKMQFPVNEEQRLTMVSNLEGLTLGNLPDVMFIRKGPTLITFQLLESLSVNGCRKLRCIFSASVIRSLPLLDDLNIKNCEELEEIISDSDEEPHFLNPSTSHPQQPCFPKLFSLGVEGCKRLRCVFPVSISQDLPCLEHLEIRRCCQLEQVFGCAPENHDAHMIHFGLPKLTELTLEELPSLTNFCRGFESQLKLEALEHCEVKDCPNFSSTTTPVLHKLMSATQSPDTVMQM